MKPEQQAAMLIIKMQVLVYKQIKIFSNLAIKLFEFS